MMSLGKKAPSNIKWVMAVVFCVFFGLNFFPVSKGLDSYKHYEQFLQYHERGSVMLMHHWEGLKAGMTDPELYVPVTYYLLSRFTDSLSVFFGFHALVYALFFVGSLKILYQMLGKRPQGIALVLFLFVVFLFPIHQINAIRWFTAMWVFIYCFLRYINGEKRFLAFAFFAGLIHFSLYVPAVFLLFSRFIGYRPYFLIGALALSFFVPRIGSSSLVENKEIIGIQSIENRTDSYTNENYVELRQNHKETLNWYVSLRYQGVHYFLILLGVLFIYKNRTRLRQVKDPKFRVFLTFVLFWAILVNLTFEIPSFGGRMRFLLWVLMASLLYYASDGLKFKNQRLINALGLGAILLYAIVDFRAYSFNVSANWLVGNPLFLFFIEGDLQLNELVFFWE